MTARMADSRGQNEGDKNDWLNKQQIAPTKQTDDVVVVLLLGAALIVTVAVGLWEQRDPGNDANSCALTSQIADAAVRMTI